MENYLFERYNRQIFIDEIGISGQRKIMNGKVLVVGAGGLGSPVIQYLAAAGVGKLGIADFDSVEIHNLNRQVIHTEKSVGKLKVESAADFVQQLNSTIEVIRYSQKIEPENIAELIRCYDIVVDCTDNFKTRYLINDACIQFNKPLVYGSILRFAGQVAVFNYKGSKNLRNIFPEAPTENIADCDSLGVLGALPGIVGSIMAMNTLKILADLCVPVNRFTVIDAWNWNFQTLDF